MLHDLMDTLPLTGAVQLRVRGQCPGARPHPLQRLALRAAVRVRPRARECGVLRPGLRSRPVGRAGGAERGPHGRSRWAVQRRRGRLRRARRDRQRRRGRHPHLRLGPRQQRHLRDCRPDADVLCGNPRRSLDANGRRAGHRRCRPDRHRHRDDHDHERRAHGHVHRARDRLRGLPVLAGVDEPARSVHGRHERRVLVRVRLRRRVRLRSDRARARVRAARRRTSERGRSAARSRTRTAARRPTPERFR